MTARRLLAWTGIGVLALGTAYLAVVGALWAVQVHQLSGTTADLRASALEFEAMVATQGEELDDVTATLDGNLTTVSALANDKAQAQDNRILYRDAALAMADCAAARGEIVPDVKAKSMWVPGPLHAWDNDVAAYCEQVASAIADLIAEEAAA